MEGLRDTPIVLRGTDTDVMSQVSLISGVSGGSILAAHYAIFGDGTFERFAEEYLDADLQGHLKGQLLNPAALHRLSSPHFGRTHLLEARLEQLYGGATLGDVAKRTGAPELLITATDLRNGMPFEFSPEQLSLICTDWRTIPLSFAVASSAAVPLLLTPMRLANHAASCEAAMPRSGGNQRGMDFRVRMLAQQARQYRNPDRYPNLHLVDGGLSDNLGLRALLDRMIATGELSDSFAGAPEGSIDTLALIVVNAERDSEAGIEAKEDVPGIGDVLDTLVFGAGSRETNVTLGILADDVRRWRAELEAERGRPGSPFTADAELHVVTLELREIPDRRLRNKALRMATSFTLPADDVALLRLAGRAVVESDTDFRRLRARLSGAVSLESGSAP
jgi:NTE family protein